MTQKGQCGRNNQANHQFPDGAFRRFSQRLDCFVSAFPILRFFRLSDDGVRCGADGLFVGAAPLLVRSPQPDGGAALTPRPADELDHDLSDLYGLPVDSAAKRNGLAAVARGLESGDLARAQIAAVLLRLPDPPSLTKDASERGSLDLARQLFESGLLKGDWDPSKHPRTGEPPNPGWFAPTDGEPESSPAAWPESPTQDELTPRLVSDTEPPTEDELEPKLPTPTKTPRQILRSLREILKGAARGVFETLRIAEWASSEFKNNLEQLIIVLEALSKTEQVELRDTQWARTSLDPPKTLAELQQQPTENLGGYEQHHVVGQNRYNLAKSPLEVAVEKFGQDAINDRSNLVWVPRLKHELITGFYNSEFPGDPQKRPRWKVVSEWDFESQRRYGLMALRLFGVLK
jgi:hypothetical protein